MKDYYSRLDLPVTATKREIEAELPAMGDATMRRNARFVLLDPERRLVYDQCHRALRQIAFLRANLGLNRAPFWKLSDCDDFNSEPFAVQVPNGQAM
jgi:curved DNA-binding protein CbpA